MTSSPVDFAVLGATPQARLVAGLLAYVHGKSVIFLGESQAGYRLPGGIDLSVGPLTRPQTWSLLKAGVPETIKLISSIGGRKSWTRLDPIFFAEQEAGKEALAHVRHLAAGFGVAAERAAGNLLGEGREGVVLRDAVMLHRPTLEPKLDRWLDGSNVRCLPSETPVVIRADGSAIVQLGDGQVEAAQTILADDAAIMAHLPPELWPALLERQLASTILTEPTEAIAAPVMQQVDDGVMLSQQAGRGIVAFGPGAIGEFASALGALLGRQRAFRQAGQSSYLRLVTGDGGPAVGRVGGTGPDVLVGFGSTGAFFAPALARWLCGVASPAEGDWLGARLIDRGRGPSQAAEMGPAR